MPGERTTCSPPPERPFAGADDYEKPASGKSSVLDLLLPVVVLIAVCVVSLIWSGGYFKDGGDYYKDFMGAFSNSSAGPALALGGLIGCVFTFVYFWLRGAIGFEKSFESVPQGFIQMIAPILILTFAWTLCSFTRNAMFSADFVKNAMAGVGELRNFLPAIIFIIGAAIGFATGTSWGTIGIMAPSLCPCSTTTLSPCCAPSVWLQPAPAALWATTAPPSPTPPLWLPPVPTAIT